MPPQQLLILTLFLLYFHFLFFLVITSAARPPLPTTPLSSSLDETSHNNNNNNNQPYHLTATPYNNNDYIPSCDSFPHGTTSRSFCIRFQAMNNRGQRRFRPLLPPLPPGHEIDPRYGVEKRLVPSGPNPLHN